VKIKIGSRKSRLARIQANFVSDRLKHYHPHLKIEWTGISTLGDRKAGPLTEMGSMGVFVKEIEQALLEGEIDLAVHSLKDMPVEQPDGLVLGALLEREDFRDALVMREGLSWDNLLHGATVGTSSPRRACQVHALRDDLVVVELRGNVETRLEKVQSHVVDAAIMATAGLKRTHMMHVLPLHIFGPDQMLPSPGQGCVAIECVPAKHLLEILQPLHHKPSALAVNAERAMLKALGGGCSMPIGALGEVIQDELFLTGMVGSLDSGILRAQAKRNIEEYEKAGFDVAADLMRAGAGRFLEKAQGKS